MTPVVSVSAPAEFPGVLTGASLRHWALAFAGVGKRVGEAGISLLYWFLLTGIFGSENTNCSSFFTEDLGVHTFSLSINLFATALRTPGAGDLDAA